MNTKITEAAELPNFLNPREFILGAVARGWCSEANGGKEMDPDLAYDIAREVEKALAAQADAVPDLFEGEKLVPYELRYFKSPGMAEKLGYVVLNVYFKHQSPTTAPASESLHSKIMNLECVPVCNQSQAEQAAFRRGHKQARHDAAELAVAHTAAQVAANKPVEHDVAGVITDGNPRRTEAETAAFEAWCKHNDKYIVRADFDAWLEQAFIDGLRCRIASKPAGASFCNGEEARESAQNALDAMRTASLAQLNSDWGDAAPEGKPAAASGDEK